MNLKALAFVLLLLPSLAASEISVRTGDHSNFTRIVFSIEENADWEVESTPDGHRILFPEGSIVDTTGFFDRISQDRILAVSTPAPGNFLELECNCEIDYFLWRANRLVVDVRNKDQPVITADEVPEQKMEEVVVSTELPSFSEDTSFLLVQPPPPVPEASPPSLEEIPHEATRHLGTLEANIVAGIAGAASQGLLEAQDTAAISTHQLDQADGSNWSEETPEQAEIGDSEILNAPIRSISLPGVSILSSIDQGRISDLGPDETAQGETCEPDSHYDLINWGTDAPFFEQVGAQRLDLFQEFDRVDSQAVEELAKLYLHFGFGREAMQILKMDNSLSKGRLALIRISEVIDGDPASIMIHPEQVSCEGAVSFWTFMAATEQDFGAELNTSAMMRTFRGLPVQLQDHLAPAFSGKLVNAGENSLANQALTNLRRQPTTLPESEIAKIEIEKSNGNEVEASERLTHLAETNGRISPEAILELLLLNLRLNRKTEPEILNLSGALRFEYSGTEIEQKLGIAEVRSHMFSENFLQASELIDELQNIIDTKQYKEISGEFALHVTDNANDNVFLEMAFQDTEGEYDPIIQNSMAERLLSLGFPNRALKILDEPATGAVMTERRYLRATANMNAGNLAEVDPILAGMESGRASSIRSDVNEVREGRRPLSRVYDLPDNIAPESENLWLTQDWQRMSEGNDELLAAVGNLVLADESELGQIARPLADGRNLLERSGDVRSTVDQLLQTV